MPATIQETDHLEAALRRACQPLVRETPVAGGHVPTLLGWERGSTTAMPAEVREALHVAHPLPDRLRGALDEVLAWQDSLPRLAEHYGDVPIWVRARLAILVGILDAKPEPTLDGLQARARWLSLCLGGKVRRGQQHWQVRCLAAIHADIDTWRAGTASAGEQVATDAKATAASTSAPVLPSPSRPPQLLVPADAGESGKRAAVLAILNTPEGQGMSSRAIARHLGVSPTTVRKARAAAA